MASLTAYKYEDREEDLDDKDDQEKQVPCLVWQLVDYTDNLKAQAASRPGGAGLRVGNLAAGTGNQAQHGGAAAAQAGPAHHG